MDPGGQIVLANLFGIPAAGWRQAAALGAHAYAGKGQATTTVWEILRGLCASRHN